MPRLLPEIPIPTPFGRVTFPQPELPPLRLKPELDERRREALRHGLGIDGTKLIGLIPVVGDFLADTISDLHGAELRRLLTPEEMDAYVKYDKVSPLDSLALIRSFIREGL